MTDCITIGITCYNAADTIERAVNSALNQTWENTEIIIVDDQSTDESVNVIQSLIKQHDHIRLFKHAENGGPAATRQTISDNAAGAFIAFFDDDDESRPERIATQHARIIEYEKEAGTDMIACYASGTRIYPNGYSLEMKAIGSQPTIPHGAAVAKRLLYYGKAPEFFFGSGTPSCALIVRKSILQKIGGFDANFRRVEDVDFAIRLALSNGHFIGCTENLFTQYATDAPDKAPEKNRDAELQLAEKHKAFLKTQGRYFYAKTWPYLRYYHFKRQYMQMILVFIKLILRAPIKTISHFMTTAPRRFLHERKMKRKNV